LMLLIDEQEKVARVAASGFRPARLCDLPRHSSRTSGLRRRMQCFDIS
jgi:hypothetical protein